MNRGNDMFLDSGMNRLVHTLTYIHTHDLMIKTYRVSERRERKRESGEGMEQKAP